MSVRILYSSLHGCTTALKSSHKYYQRTHKEVEQERLGMHEGVEVGRKPV